MPSFKEGDLVTVTNYGGDAEGRYNGLTGPISKICPLHNGELYYYIDVGISGFFFRDLICYEDEFEHAKEETHE
jgi:hypothetical protein